MMKLKKKLQLMVFYEYCYSDLATLFIILLKDKIKNKIN